MQIVNLKRREFNNLKLLELPNNIFNTEAQMYVIPSKNKWDKKQTILKRLYIDMGEMFSNKLYTIHELLDKKDEINIEELVMPEALAAVDGNIVGFTMPYVPNINLQTVLDAKEFSTKEKIAYLKEVGELLEKLKKVREYSDVKDFYLNDIHENNFILNKVTGHINAVDLDSCKIGNNLTAGAKYLSPVSKLQYVSKYVPLEHSIGGVYEVSEDTEIYCYIIMIFNFFFGSNISRLTIQDFYVYLDYLSSIGVSKEFLDKVSCIYINKNNENPYEYLECLEPFYGRTHKNTFELVRKKRG